MAISMESLKQDFGMDEPEFEEIAASADLYNSGSWPEGEVCRVGRPLILGHGSTSVTVRLPADQVEALDARASLSGQTRSAAVREAIEQWLRGAAAL